MAGPKVQKKRRPAGTVAPKGQDVQQIERPPKQLVKPAHKQSALGEEDFPRGGVDALTALERRELAEAALKEVEQELAGGKQPKKKKPRIAKTDDDGDAFFSKQGSALEGKFAKHVDLLRAKDLNAGTRVWGMVLEVAPRGLVISLPDGLRGHVAPKLASDVLGLMLKAQMAANRPGKAGGDGAAAARNKGTALLEAAGGVVPPLTDLFAVGQYVRCAVKEAPTAGADADAAGDGKRRNSKHVTLSLLLHDVQGGLGSDALTEGLALGAVVRSVEDHGYTLSFGIKGTSGFLRKKDHEAQFGEGVALQAGGLIDVVVKNAADKRNVLVSCAPEDVAGAVMRDADGAVIMDGLLPGALVNVKVRKVLSNGLMVSFLTFFHGTVNLYHLPATVQGNDWRKTYTEGAKLRARLLYVDPSTKRAGLSMLPHLLALTLPSPVPVLGSVFEEAEVLRVDAFGGPGMVLKLEGLPEGPVTGYCHVANMLEEKVAREEVVAEITKRFKLGTKVPARVIGYRLLDGMASVTVRPSQVHAAVLSFRDLSPGMVVTGTVLTVPDRDGEGPLRIQLAEGIVGLVPRLHARELTRTTGPERKKADSEGRIKVKVGDRVEARVLDLDPADRKLCLTLRKALLTAKAAPLVSMVQAVPGARFHGVVTGFNDRMGVFVSFFGGLSGLAAQNQLGIEAGQSAKDVFAIGQVVRATILAVAGGRIKLSLASKSAAAAAAEASAAAAPVATANGSSGGAADPMHGLQPGHIAEAVVLEVNTGGDAATDVGAAAPATLHYICRLECQSICGEVRAKLEATHLSDHPAALEAFKAVVRPGARLGRVVVLERQESQRCVLVSRKPSLLAAAAAGTLPRSFEDVREGIVLPGFVASVTADAVYVRFLGGLTGRAGLPQLADVFVSDPRPLFSQGQSVRGLVATCDAARQRFTLLLKPSATASTDGVYLLDYLREMLQLQTMRAEAEAMAPGGGGAADNAAAALPSEDTDLTKKFPLGSRVAARVHEVKGYGILCDMDKDPDVVGLVPSSHTGEAGTSLAVGSCLHGRVLDVVGHQGLIEISLKAEMLEATKDKAAAKEVIKKLKAGEAVEAIVEGIRPGEYLIFSLPKYASLLAYAAITDYNIPRADQVPQTFTVGQRVTATVAILPPEAPSGRIICHVPLTRASPAGGRSSGGGGAVKVHAAPGSVVQAVVTAIQPDQLDVSIGSGKLVARIHMTEVIDVDVEAMTAAAAAAATPTAGAAAPNGDTTRASKKARKAELTPAAAVTASAAGACGGNPLDGFTLQQTVEAVVLGRLHCDKGHHFGPLDLSLRPSRLAVAKKGETFIPPMALTDISPGQKVPCFVLEVSEDGIWLGIGPVIRGRVAVLDASSDPSVLSNLPASFPVGSCVLARVLTVDVKTHKVDLSLIDPCSGTTHGSVTDAGAETGELVMGRILAVSGGGVRVGLGRNKQAGTVALTDIHDQWVPDALAGLKKGMYVRVRVLGRNGEYAVLSLRPSRGGAVGGTAAAAAASTAASNESAEVTVAIPELLQEESVKVGKMLSGYVRSCDSKGLFMTLDRFRTGRIALVNLSDGFIEDPAAAFPAGMRVEARVLRVHEDGRVDLSIRTSTRSLSKATLHSMSELKPGQLVSGSVRRVEPFGVLVELSQNAGIVGLAHRTNLADHPVKDPGSLYKAKQSVRAVVLNVDLEKSRLALALQPSKIQEAEAAAAEAAKGAKGTKRRRVARDIDEEIAAAADDGEEDADDECSEQADKDAMETDDDDGDEEDKALALDSDVDVDDVDVSDEDEEEGEEGGGGSGSEDMAEEEEEDGSDDDSDGDELEEGDEEEEEKGKTALGRSKPGATSTGNLDLTAPWGELLLADDPRVNGGPGPSNAVAKVEDVIDERKLSKGQKKRLKEQHEQDIRAAELARLSGSAAPTTVADFERLALTSPNSSFVWIKFMALHLSLGDVDAARKLAQRALNTINYREVNEKFNVWVAWLNLENAYGTKPSPEEAVMEMLKRALQYTDQKKMYLAALGIFERSGRDELAEQVMRALTKKFGGSVKVWERAIERTLQKGDEESGRKLLERALQSLPARKHVKALLRVALAEFRLGNAERGRGILEGVLRNYPKRLDLWNVYIDQELKTGEQQRIRALFERATHLPLPPKKMKFLFRRYLEYEKSEGDTAAVEHVKRRAMEFVESSLKA